ncbi:sigma-70 family RNA polymerase sigma factor [Conexibacter sp. CPCC 206217]|uniref:sigma-70 family RNA polymerase sigma factor n=1 Tax=Conexibacter sp. CPCC 206217 TaxID=3064574 RepID=UPI002728B052|nr:sigma-70 family RNA polymerase sigma factor [Conexibacter sp. CPCC 206217]MDO8210861.1 sigma-70 family RNA polymerase sigma factor [Conexibacter sp. CPCC 206217]
MLSSPDASAPIERELESHRRALTGYCYRMLGSGSEAEDAVQETMVRAWKAADRLEARAALKSWLYRIASNVCFDILQSAQRRAQPMDLGPSSTADGPLGAPLPETAWVQPIADARILPVEADPADVADARETLRLAFVAALQHLPARQRAVLILREVLRWQATEVAELLDTSVASVNSALQRARTTLQSLDLDRDGTAAAPSADIDAEQQELLSRYVDAFERYDIGSLVALLQEDATFSMPPLPLWLHDREQVGPFMLGPGAHCRGSRLLVTQANGGPAVGIYHPTPEGHFEPWAIVVVEMSGGRISALHHFLFTELFAEFGLPPQLERHGVGQSDQA